MHSPSKTSVRQEMCLRPYLPWTVLVEILESEQGLNPSLPFYESMWSKCISSFYDLWFPPLQSGGDVFLCIIASLLQGCNCQKRSSKNWKWAKEMTGCPFRGMMAIVWGSFWDTWFHLVVYLTCSCQGLLYLFIYLFSPKPLSKSRN